MNNGFYPIITLVLLFLILVMANGSAFSNGGFNPRIMLDNSDQGEKKTEENYQPGALAGSGLLSLAESLYHEGSFDAAIRTLKTALKKLPAAGDNAKAHLLLGMVYLAQQKSAQAQNEFKKALGFDPDLNITTDSYPPNAVGLFNKVHLETLGSLSVQTSPPGAEIFLNGKSIGRSPVVKNNIPAGVHLLKIEKNLYLAGEKKITVHGAEQCEFFLNLAKIDVLPPGISHEQVYIARQGMPFTVRAVVKDNSGVAKARLYFRKRGARNYESAPMVFMGNELFEGTVPVKRIFPSGLEYYINAEDNNGNATTMGSANRPLKVRVIELDKEAPIISHTPIKKAPDPGKLVIKAQVTDNKRISHVTIFFRRANEIRYTRERMVKDAYSNWYSANIARLFPGAGRINYYIEAVDKAGNLRRAGTDKTPYNIEVGSALPGNEIDVQYPAKGAVQKETKGPPVSPTGLRASLGQDGKTSLSWDPNPEAGIDHYEIYSHGFLGKKKAGESAEPHVAINGIKPGKTYTYSVIAVDKDGLRSEPSAPFEIKALEGK